MYIHFFSLKQAPFSIAPDPRYLLMTGRHREALAHLMYGMASGGGIVLLTGEVGAGKTTVCRCFLEQVPASCNVAYIFNPKLTVDELLRSVCEEFRIGVAATGGGRPSVKDHVDALTRHLLASHAEGRNNVLVIDEAQNLSADVLEQLRLLTNLETSERKLLQIILIGQPELQAMLARPELRQLEQRVIARYHLNALSEAETASYVQHRLAVAGLLTATPFQPRVMRQIHRLTRGVPRRINLLCDRALLGAFAEDKREVDSGIISKAAREVFGEPASGRWFAGWSWRHVALASVAALAVAGSLAWTMTSRPAMKAPATPAAPAASGTSTTSTTPATSGIQKKAKAPASPVPAPPLPMPATDTTAPLETSMPAPAQIVSETDGGSRLGFANETDALRELARLWGVALRDGEPCKAAREGGLQCFRSANGFADLRQLDRPAILRLQGNDSKAYHVLLTGLGDNSATISAGNATQTISLGVLKRYFRGEFATFWRAPGVYRGNMEYGSRGDEVDWLATQLATVASAPVPVSGQTFNEKMVAQVKEFQSMQGLKADGVVGPATFMRLNRATGIEEPRLRTADGAKRINSSE